MPDTTPVFHVRTSREKGKVLEKIAADSAEDAKAIAKELLGDIDGVFVTGPHERVALSKGEPAAERPSAVKAPEK